MMKLKPSCPADAGALEQWLETLAQKGWMLREFGTRFAYFDKCDPTDCRFRCEPVGKTVKPEPEQLDLYAALGWTWVDDTGDLWRVYRCDDLTAPELNTDPSVQEFAYRRHYRKTRRQTAIGILILLAAWAFLLVTTLRKEQPVETLLMAMPTIWLLLPESVLCLVELVYQQVSCRRVWKRLRSGVPMDHTGPWRWHRAHSVVFWTIHLCVMIAAVVTPFVYIALSDYGPLEETEGPLPYVELTALDPALASEEPVWSTCAYDAAFLSPDRWEIWERYEDARCATILHRLRFDFLAEPLYREKLDAVLAEYPGTEPEPVALPEADEAVLLALPEGECLLARQGDRVLYVRTFAIGGMEKHLEEYAALLNG